MQIVVLFPLIPLVVIMALLVARLIVSVKISKSLQKIAEELS